jgi:nicotinamide-nucleotide amidase
MEASIITVGDEILCGHITNTNSAYLAGRMCELGIRVKRISTVADDIGEIRAELEAAIESADLVFVTGGLGPTQDDVTKQALARVVGRELVVDKDLHTQLAERMAGRRTASAQAIESLSLVPEGATTIGNPVGAAVGLRLEYRERHLFVLPGVPREMKSIFEGAIVGILKDIPKDEVSGSRLLKTTGIRELEIASLLEPLAGEIDAGLGYLPRPEGVDLRLTAVGADREDVGRKLDEAVGRLLPLLGEYVFSTEGEELNLVVGTMLIERGKTLAVAESCTGGLIGHLLTQVPGISACLDRVVVTYSDKSKVHSLSVGEDLLREHGAVSREVADAMATGVRALAGTDIGLSTTGIAGPSGETKTKPVGLVYMGLAHAVGSAVCENVFPGSREVVKLKAATHALDMLRIHLAGRGK